MKKIDSEKVLKKILPHLQVNFNKTLKMVASLLKLQIKNMKPEVVLSILLKYAYNIDLVQTSEDKKRLISIFEGYKSTWQGQIKTENYDLKVNNLEQTFQYLQKMAVIFELDMVDDSFKFNSTLNRLEKEFSLFH